MCGHGSLSRGAPTVARRAPLPEEGTVMTKLHARLSRRRFLASAAIGAAATATGALARPSVLRAQGAGVKFGLLHPVTGALSYSGQQGRIGATMAVDEINAGGAIKALGGAKIDPMFGDAQSTPDGGTAEVEKMNAAEVSCIIGGYASSICLAVSQAAARYDLPYVIDVGVADSIVTRGLKNTFRFGPGFGVIANSALDNLTIINDQAGKPAKTVIIVSEDSLFGSGLAKLLNAQLPAKGFQILETIPHPTPTRDFNNVVLKIKAQSPDLVIPANYYNEYVLLARTMQEQRVRPKAIYSVLGGAASSYKFIHEFPDAAKYIMDCNHWFNPKSAKALELKKKVEDKGQFYTYELYMKHTAVQLVADALEHAASADRAKLTAALENSTFSGHIMPYGPTKFVNGQNQGAAPVNTQVLDNDIKVILPPEFANAKVVFPMPA
jgi:branched-chain amino acid transport system substrate-binding protein